MATSRLSGGALSTPIGSTELAFYRKTFALSQRQGHSPQLCNKWAALEPSLLPRRMTISEIEQLNLLQCLQNRMRYHRQTRVSYRWFQMVDGHLSSPTDQAADTMQVQSSVGLGSPAVVQPMVQQRRTLDIKAGQIGRVQRQERKYWEPATAACLTATCSYPGAQEPERRI